MPTFQDWLAGIALTVMLGALFFMGWLLEPVSQWGGG